ncbi:MAG: enoyl-CoA hydratase [Rhodospirillaceae bacterium]|nr:enoyl-CoA hydratase [Rhodospirillaceae bacterium]|tara:strand:+ start:142 stop:936 length:795 start_codon:yes stop_codon:yes gene_type:complete
MDLPTDKMIGEKRDGVGHLIFNNPEKRNATSLEMWQAAKIILDDFSEDPRVRCLVVSGAGDKSFVAGADISQFEKARSNADAAAEYEKISAEGKAALANFQKPIIAMIQGYCLGGGMAVALSADFRICSDDSQLGIPAARLSIAYSYDAIYKLCTLVGPSYAKDILITARRIKADEAHRIGLVNRVVPASELEAAVAEYTDAILENAPLSIQATKMTVTEILKNPEDRDMEALKEIGRICFDSNDYKEGRTAFMEKRKPVFTGT